MLMTKSTNPRSISSMTHPPSPAGVMAPATVSADGRVVLRQQHLVREDVTGLGQAAGVERLKPLVYQLPDLGAATRPVVADRLCLTEVVGAACGRGRRASDGAWR